MEKIKVNKSEKKKFFYGLLIGSLAILILFFIIFLANTNTDNATTVKFDDYLETGDFDTAYKEFESMTSLFQIPFENYIKSIVARYNNSIITYDETILLFDELTNSGFSSEIVDNSIEQVELIFASKEIFNFADNLYKENKHSEAKNSYGNVIELDINFSSAQEKIIEIDALLQTIIDDYTNADTLYLNNDIDQAYEQYKIIVEKGIDAEDATNKVTSIESVDSAWEKEFQDDNYNRCSYPYGITEKNDFIYLPYSHNQTHSIVKYNLTEETTEIFVLSNVIGSFIIKDINVIDNYLYFIAGQQVGSGRMIKNPYNIYRMKDDGTDLERVALGDYKYLVAYKDGFYAATYSNGLVKLDRNLKFINQICEKTPEQIQLVEDKLYYTLAEYTPYDMLNAQYAYDGESSTKIKQDTMLQFGFYSGIELYTYKGYEYYEKLFFSNPSEDKLFMLKFDDIKMLYGLVGDNIVYSMETPKGRDNYYVYSRSEQKEIKYSYKLPKNITKLNSICFDKDLIIFESQEGFAIADSSFDFIGDIVLSNTEIGKMDINNSLTFTNDPVYTDEEVVIVEDGFWHYSDSTYHVTIESKYIYDIDTNVYIAQIRTTDPKGIYLESPADDTYISNLRKNPRNLSRQLNAVIGCNGDFFNENDWTGITIRDGIVYQPKLKKDMLAIYPDGSIICHSAEEELKYEDLLYAGVRDTLSFGPILLSDGEYGNDVYTNFLAGANPRCAIGMVEPGHYVIILVDGRQPNSAGMTLKRLTDLFLDEGCVEAYNLDGGQSAALMFMGEYVNTHKHDYTGSGFRAIGELVYFGTSDLVPDEIG